MPGSVLAAEKDEDKGEDKADWEDEEVDGRVLTLWTSWITRPFFFLIGGQMVELEAEQFVAKACMSVLSWSFFFLCSRWT